MTQSTIRQAALELARGVATFIQGEVLAVADACVVLADAARPLSEEASEVVADAGLEDGLIVVPHAVDEVVLLTQTCDLQFTTATEHRCLVSPVVRVSRQLAREATLGRRPQLAGLPWLGDDAVADLSRITTVERSVLVGAEALGRPNTPSERFHFAETISRYLTRPALPDAINEVLRPFVRRVSEKHDKRSPEGRCAFTVRELRLEATPDLDADEPALNVLMMLDEQDLPTLPAGQFVDQRRVDRLTKAGRAAAAEAVEVATDAASKREAWTALAECWVQPSVDLVPDAAGVGGLGIEVLNGEELTYARSLSSPLLDLRYLSTRVA